MGGEGLSDQARKSRSLQAELFEPRVGSSPEMADGVTLDWNKGVGAIVGICTNCFEF